MNNQLIEKIITTNNTPCPKFIFENPLLDKNVAKALSKSFVKILNISQQNVKVNNNLRISILENIRKICQIEPENHLKVNENITALLKDVYEQKLEDINNECENSTNKELDAFLIRNMKDMNINSRYKPPINAEIMQALNNLKENEVQENMFYKDIIHWDVTDKKNIHILKSLWTKEDSNNEDIFIKLKTELERNLLEMCNSILSDNNFVIKDFFTSNDSLKNIITKSAISANCFQISCSILNYVFINTNFNTKIQTFVQMFVQHVKDKCPDKTISTLYPLHMSHILILLDIDLEELPTSVQNDYVKTTKEYLCKLRTESENDLIMLLSHYPKWFNIYFMD